MAAPVKPWRLALKATILFAVFELAFLTAYPDYGLLNLYRSPDMKRQRFPISTHPPQDAALDVGNLQAMFASHQVSEPKRADELRVIILGDSAIWGFLLGPGQTFPGQLDSLGLECGTKRVRAYNLSYPRPSATKDLMILDRALQSRPDLVVWMLTLSSLMPKKRVDHVLLTQNPFELYQLNDRLHFLPGDYPAETPTEHFISRHRSLFRVLRYQLYSLVVRATGMDQIPGEYESVPRELTGDVKYEGFSPPGLNPKLLLLDELQDAYQLAGEVPVLLVNEPILIQDGVPNSDVRYNGYYPRWVYDEYRQVMQAAAVQNHWEYLDLWNMFTPEVFTNTPLHLNPEGELRLAKAIAPAVLQKVCK